ncbi:metal-dependent hydrolase [Desulfosporosinus sp. SYSU MS00001]|uniref:metal-dependent hydrolase n=1 Tax=Desulfosporosinus sp. SYSU MS00001 TaxID=3416284 RepID=UPI003CF3B0DC
MTEQAYSYHKPPCNKIYGVILVRFETHRSIGITSYSIIILLILPVTTINQLFQLLIVIPITFVSSVLPDYDNDFNIEHRGPTHSIFIWAFLSVLFAGLVKLLYWYLNSLKLPPILAPILAFSAPYFMHLIADSFTDNGVRLFWPYNMDKPRKPIFRLWYYSDGKMYEQLVSLGVNTLSLVLWIGLFYHTLK